MTDSVSVVIGGEAAARLSDEPVVPAARGEGEDALADARPDALRGVAAVALERELALEGVVDRLDPLTDAAQRTEARRLVLAVGSDELGAERVSDELLELGAGEAFVGDEDLLACSRSPRAASSSSAAAISRSGSLAGAKQNAIGIPSGAQTRYSRSPQK